MKTRSTFVLLSVLFSACGTSQHAENFSRVQVAKGTQAKQNTQAKQERVPVASVPPPLTSVSARASAVPESVPESESFGPFLYPDERIPVPKSNGILLANDTGLSPNPPLDTGCGYQELADQTEFFKHTFQDTFEELRTLYIQRVNKDIAKRKEDTRSHPSYNFQLKYALNRLEDPKPGVKVWQVLFFSDFSTLHIVQGRTLYIGHARITQTKPCLYSGSLNYSYFRPEDIQHPFLENTEYTFDYTNASNTN